MSYQGISPGQGLSQANISNEIRQEILRFESVHPSIYAIYDLIDGITDPNLKDQIRDHVVCIEDSFVNSQEWTSSRYVPDIKLGIVGFVNSGKSALVHRYLTGSYMHEESPEGGRFKKEVQIDGQSYLLLIRDEGGIPEAQFTNWVDAVILVFSLENEMSFNAVHSYYNKMCHYRDISQMPIILVGTQDAISESNPRVIEDARAKKLEAELGSRCRYYETCATYGLNVEHVFQDACQKASNERFRLQSSASAVRVNGSAGRTHSSSSSGGGYTNPRLLFQQHQQQQQPRSTDSTPVSTRSDTPPGSLLREHTANSVHRHERQQRVSSATSSAYSNSTTARPNHMSPPLSRVPHSSQLPVQPPLKQQYSPQERQEQFNELRQTLEDVSRQQAAATDAHYYTSQQGPELTPVVKRRGKKLSSSALRKSNSFHGVLDKRQTTPNSTPLLSRKHTKKSNTVNVPVYEQQQQQAGSGAGDSGTDNLPTPSSTPTQARKSRRRSNIFNTNPRKDENKGDELGSGRAIPVKQGYLYKKGSKGITKDWKKKYVTLTENGKLIYHPNMHDYMENSHGKEISLMHTTVKIPGQSKPRLASQISNGSVESSNASGDSPRISKNHLDNGNSTTVISNSAMLMPVLNGLDDDTVAGVQAAKIDSNTPHVKRRHRRAKSGTKIETNGDGNDSDGYEFLIVSLDNKQWHFEAPTQEDRDVWVGSIEKRIFHCLQGNDSLKKAHQDPNAAQAIRNTPGNHVCCDCDTPKPSWASLNLGSLICIECSGIHRNLGTHLSRVRSLELDEWPPDLTAVMLAIGNLRSNSVWEAKAKNSKHKKPIPSSSREEKEAWIRAKYEQKLFLPNRSHRQIPLSHLLIDAMARQELTQVILLLADSSPDDVSFPYSNDDRRTPLHIAAQQGNAIFLQLLLWYGADVRRLDQEGKSALWYARYVGSKDCAAILQSNGCPDNTATLPRLRRGSLQQQHIPVDRSSSSLY